MVQKANRVVLIYCQNDGG